MLTQKEKQLARLDFRGKECRNCHAVLDIEDRFCHSCGQKNNTKKLSLKDYLVEFLSTVFSYDSRIWRTIKHLIFKPGFVPREFIRGKRTRYANPFRFFFTVSIIYFLVVRLVIFIVPPEQKNGKTELASGAIQFTESPSDTIAKKREINIPEGTSPMKRKMLLAEMDKDLNYYTQKELDDMLIWESFYKQSELYQEYIEVKSSFNFSDAMAFYNHDYSDFNHFVHKRAITYAQIKEDPAMAVDLFLPKAPLFIFFFIPALSVFYLLLYRSGGYNYIEHIIFNFSIFTFLFLVLIPLNLIDLLFEDFSLSTWFMLLVGPFYFYKALRRFYEQRRGRTILKFILINIIFAVLGSFGVGIFIALGLVIA